MDRGSGWVGSWPAWSDRPAARTIPGTRQVRARGHGEDGTPHTAGMGKKSKLSEDSDMVTSLTLARVAGDVDVLSRSGLDIAGFLAEVDASLQRAVPYVASCFCTTDPATKVLTTTFKFGDLADNDEHDLEWGVREYGVDDPTSFRLLVHRELPALGVQLETDGDLHASQRMADFIRPRYGYEDELRMVGRQRGRLWGGMALFRGPDDPMFSPEEIAFVGSLSERYAAGLRASLLVRTAGRVDDTRERGPAVAIVDANDRIRQVSVGAHEILEELARVPHMSSTSGTVASLVANARRFALGHDDALPRARVRLPSGRWVVMHASPLASADGIDGDVVVTMEEARPPEIIPIVVEAFALTARERDVTQLVLQGVETKDIAATLHLSRYTVQDHLKSVFDKAGVRSRRELTARVYFDQYVPRLGNELAPSGWFAAPPEPAPAKDAEPTMPM